MKFNYLFYIIYYNNNKYYNYINNFIFKLLAI